MALASKTDLRTKFAIAAGVIAAAGVGISAVIGDSFGVAMATGVAAVAGGVAGAAGGVIGTLALDAKFGSRPGGHGAGLAQGFAVLAFAFLAGGAGFVGGAAGGGYLGHKGAEMVFGKKALPAPAAVVK